jgi:hypothetical protein
VDVKSVRSLCLPGCGTMPRRRSILCACILSPPLRKGVYRPFHSEKIVRVRLTQVVLCRSRQGRGGVVLHCFPGSTHGQSCAKSILASYATPCQPPNVPVVLWMVFLRAHLVRTVHSCCGLGCGVECDMEMGDYAQCRAKCIPKRYSQVFFHIRTVASARQSAELHRILTER